MSSSAFLGKLALVSMLSVINLFVGNHFINGKALPWHVALASAGYMGGGALGTYAGWMRAERLALVALGLFCVALAVGIAKREKSYAPSPPH